MLKVYVGIDPGVTGAVAAVTKGGQFAGVWPAPTVKVKKGKKNRSVYLTPSMAGILRNLAKTYQVVAVVMENVGSMPGQGVASMFQMGRGVGMWEGVVATLGLQMQYVAPQSWKKSYGLGRDKNEARARATQLFPLASHLWKLKKDDGKAEALLMAEYLRRKSVQEK